MRRIAVALRLLVLGLYALVIVPLQMLALRFGWPILHRLPMSFHRMFLRLFGVRAWPAARSASSAPRKAGFPPPTIGILWPAA